MEMVHDICSTLPTEFCTALTTILLILFQYCYKYCYSDSRNLWAVLKGEVWCLKSDSTHHFFRNVCTKSGSLRFSQFSGCWLILSVYIPLEDCSEFGNFVITLIRKWDFFLCSMTWGHWYWWNLLPLLFTLSFNRIYKEWILHNTYKRNPLRDCKTCL